MASMDRRRLVIGGRGAALSVEDVFNVSCLGFRVELDAAALEHLSPHLDSSINGPIQSLQSPLSDSSTPLPSEQSRAAITVHLIKLMQEQGTHPHSAQSLADSLNSSEPLRIQMAPLETSGTVAGSLNTTMSGLTLDPTTTSPLPPPLDPSLLHSASLGISALAVHFGQCLSSSSLAVAALSSEALELVTRSGGVEWENVGGPGGGKPQADVAAELRALLAGSTCVNPRKGGSALPALLTVPQLHGALREALKSAATCLRLELNPEPSAMETATSSQGGSKGGKGKGKAASAGSAPPSLPSGSPPPSPVYPPVAVVHHVSQVLQLLLPVLSRVRDRIAAMAAKLPPSPSLSSVLQQAEGRVSGVRKACVDAALLMASCGHSQGGGEGLLEVGVQVSRELLSAVEQEARHLLAVEAVLALALLDTREANLAARQQQQQQQAAGGGGSVPPKAVKGGSGKPPAGLQLGRGTRLIRALLLEAGSAGEGSTADIGADVERMVCALDARGPQLASLLSAVRGAVESNEVGRVPKIPKGTRDFLPEQMAVRGRAFDVITAVFRRHGAVEIDTPVFELRETLMGKYGEDSKLIYDLADQGGEVLSLRYDLTVPFARYLAMHPHLGHIKRYHIAKVYRRDNPQMKRGRFREFYQCDLDVAGSYPLMMPDSEVIKVLTELLDELGIGEYEVKLNHRGLLDGMLALCGVPSAKFRAICSAIDKLDKEPWDTVRTEMIAEKGLSEEVADKIGTFVVKKGEPMALLEELRAEGGPFAAHAGAMAALHDLSVLFSYLEALGGLHRVVLDLSLARGLDYYTGMIFEAVFKGESQVGSIAAGGRYDNLVGMFSGKQVPAVGMSLGIERVFTIMMDQMQQQGTQLRSTQTQVLVASIGPDLTKTRMSITNELWQVGIKAEYVFAQSPNMQKQLEYANKTGIPWMVIFGSDELQKGTLKVKDLINRTEEEIKRCDLISELQKRLV